MEFPLKVQRFHLLNEQALAPFQRTGPLPEQPQIQPDGLIQGNGGDFRVEVAHFPDQKGSGFSFGQLIGYGVEPVSYTHLDVYKRQA